MKRLLILVLTTVVGCGPQGVQPTTAPTPAATAAQSAVPAIPSRAPLSSWPSSTISFDWSERVAPIHYAVLPNHPDGHWILRSPLDKSVLLMTLEANGPPTGGEFKKHVVQLARLDLPSGTPRTLVRLPAGMQVVHPIVVGRTVAWIEASGLDLRALGWRLHLTQTDSGSDRVVAQDPGIRVGDMTVLPAIGFDGTSVLFTALTRQRDALVWQLRRLRDGREETIAELTDPQDQRFLQVVSDGDQVVWSEQSARSLTTRIGRWDGSGAVRQAMPPSAGLQTRAVYQIIPVADGLLLATDAGVMKADRTGGGLVQISPESAAVDQIALLGSYVLYKNSDESRSAAALDLRSGAHALLGRYVNGFPYANGVVMWVEGTTAPGRIGTVSLHDT